MEEENSSPPFTGTTMKKYKKQMDWRRNKIRVIFKRVFPI
jgi:hypothetical protein